VNPRGHRRRPAIGWQHVWDRWIGLLLRFYPRRFRERFGDDLRAQYAPAGRPTLRGAMTAFRDLLKSGLGARTDDARTTWRTAALPGLDAMRVDSRHIVRGLRRRPLFPLAVVSTLALAGGLTAVVFAILDTTLLRPLPYSDAGRLVSIGNKWIGFDHASLSIPEFLDYRTRNRSLESIAAYTSGSFNMVTSHEGPERLLGARVTASFFDVLGVRPVLGRVFTADEDRPGLPRVVVLSHGLWSRRFGADPSVLGTRLTFDWGTSEVIGVMPPELRLPGADTELWVPLSINTASPGSRGNHNRQVIARMKPDVGLEQARAELRHLAIELQREHPDSYPTGSGWDASVRGLRDHLFGDLRTPLSLLMTAVLFVVLIACANVTNLMAARASERRHELATRLALGAPRLRLVQHALIEGLLMGVTGGAAGLALGSGVLRLLRSGLPERLPVPDHIATDLRVAAFAVGVTACAGVLASLATLRARQMPMLGAHRGSSDTGANRIRVVLTASQIAIATFLLVAGAAALRGFAALVRQDPGVATERIATARVTALSRYAQLDALAGYFDRIVTSVAQTPGVMHAGLVSILPLSGDTSDRLFVVEGRVVPGQPSPGEQLRAVGGEYFQALGIPLIAGRYFDRRDGPSGEPVAIISRLAATKYWGDQHPVGSRINFSSRASEPWITIVGVVGDIRHRGLDSSFVPVIYVPVSQLPERSLTVVARLEPSWQGGGRLIAEAVRAVDNAQPVFAELMMDDWVARSIAEPRFNLTLLTLFALLAIALTAVGIYGVMTAMVTRRTRELGVRLALGARPATLLRVVLRHGAFITGVGLMIGLVASRIASAFMGAVLIGARAIDPVMIVSVTGIVLGVALFACFVPARRAMRVDPIVALRTE
jgi:putative ABC transport system permease protein